MTDIKSYLIDFAEGRVKVPDFVEQCRQDPEILDFLTKIADPKFKTCITHKYTDENGFLKYRGEELPFDAKVDLEGNELNWNLVRSGDPRVAGRSCKHEARTSAKDSMLLEAFGLTGGIVYTIDELIATVQKNMTEAVFEKSCGKCSWREQGLCNYAMWQEHFPKLFSK